MPSNPPRPGTGSTVASFSSASDFYDDAQNQSTQLHSSSSPPPAPSTGASRTANNPRSSTSSNSGSGSGSNSGSSPANRATRRSSQRIGKSFEALLASNETWVLKETVDLADDPSNSQMQAPSSSSGGSTGTFGGGPGGMTRSSSSNSTGMSLSLADEVATDGKEDSKKKSSRKLGRKTNSREGGNEQAADNGFTSFRKVLTRKPKWEEEDAEEANREREEMENRKRRAGGNNSNYDSMRSISSSSSSRDQQQQQPTSSSSNSLKYQSTSSPSSAQVAFGSNVSVPPGRSSSSSLGGVQTTTMIERSPSSSTRTSSVASTANNHKFATPPEGGASPAGGVILNLPSSESNGSYHNRRRGSDSIERKGSSGDAKGLSTEDRDKRRSYLRAGGTASSPDLKTLVSKKMAQQSSQQQGGSSPIQGSHNWDSPSISSATPTQSQMASSSASSYVQTTKDAPLPSVPNESPALEPTTRSRSSNQSSDKTRLPFPQGSSGTASEEGGSIDSNVTANPINVRQPAKCTGASTSKKGGFGSSTGTSSSSSKPPNLQSSSKSYTSDATISTTRSKSGGGTISGNAPISLAQESIMSSPSLDTNPTSTSGAFKERMKKTSGFLKKLGGGGGGSSSSREREKSASKNINSLPAPPTPSATNYASSVKSGVSSSTNTISKKASQASLAAAAASSSEQDSLSNNSNLMRNQDIAPVPTIPAQYVSEKPGTSIPPPPVRGQKSASRKEKERKNPTAEGMGLGIGMGIPSSSSQSLGRSPSTPLSASTSTSTPVPPRSSSTQIPTSNNEKSQDSAISTHIRKISSAAGGSDSSGGELRSALKAWESEMDETLKESAKDLEKKTEFKPRNQWGPSPQLPDLGLDIDLADARDGEDGRERRQRSRSFMDEDDSNNLTALSSPTSLLASSNSNHTETQTDQNTPSMRSPGLAGGKFPWNRSKSPAGRSSTSEGGGGKTSTGSTPQVSSPKSYTFEEKDYSSTLSPADVPSRKNSTSPSFPGALPKERISSGSSTSETSASLLNRNGSPNSASGTGSGFLGRDGGSGSSALVGGRHLSRKETSSIAASLASFETTPETPDNYSKFYTAGSNFAVTWAKEKEEEEKREKNRTSVTSEEVETKDSLLRPSEVHQEEDEDDSDLKINPEDSIRLIPRRKGSSNTSGGKSANEPEDDQQPPTPLDSNFISRDSALSSSSSKSDLPFTTPNESSDRGNLSASALETIAEGSHSRDPSLAQTSAAPPLVYPATKAISTANPVPGFRKLSLDVNAAPRSSSSSTQGGEISRESSPGPGKTSTSSSAVGPSSIPLHPMERRVSHASVTSLPSNVASPTSRVPSLGVTDMDNLVDNEDESTLEEARELAMKCWNEDESFLKKEKISEWLGGIGKINKIALVIYFSKFDFAGLRVDAAFRKLCDKLFLRAETQQVDRILHAFSQRFWHSNPNSIYGSADVVHSIVFSLLLLNTDLHVADIAERMTRNQFVKNTMSAISDQKLADSFTTSPSIGDDTRSSLSVNVTDHDEKTGSMSPSLSAASGLGGSLSGRSRPSRSGSIRVTRSGSKDPISSGGNNGSTPNLASTNNNGNSRSFSASTDEISSPPLSATRSPGKSSAPPSAAFNSSTRGRNAGASVDIDRSKYNTTSKSWEAELEMLLKDIYVAVKGDQIRLPSSDRLLSPALASQRRTAKAGGPGTDRVSALKRGSIRGIQGLLGNNSFPSEDALSQTSSIGSRSLGDSWAFQTTGSSSTSPSVGSSLHPPTLGFANTLSHSIIKESQDEDVARSINSEQEEVDDDELALMGPPWAKEGVLTRKHYWDAPQKRAKDKAWVEVFVVVQKGTLSMFKFGSDSSSSKASAGSSAPVGGGNWLSNATSLGEVPLAHALANALPPPGYNRSRPHVLALTLPGGAVYFFQAGHEDLVHEWVSTCNYWAARQSREPLAAGVSNMEYGWNKVLPSQYDDEEDLDEREETTSIVSGFSSPPDGSIYNAPITPHGPKASDTRSIRSGKSTSARSMRARGAALYQNWHEAASLVTPGGGQSKDKDNGSIYGAGAASIMSSPGTSMMSGGGVGSHANERTFINEWKPPVSTTVPSTLKEEEQLDRCISQVTRIEEELTAHTNLRQPMLGLYGPRSSNGAKALSNWERKSNHLLQELVKYQCYVESLKGAVRMRAEKRGKREVDALLEQADDEMSRVRQDEEGGPVKA